jgi:hypothetical protein
VLTFLCGLPAVVVLWRAGTGALAPPPLDPAGWQAWWSEREHLDALAALARLVTLAASGWLLAATALHALVVAASSLHGRAVHLARLTARLAPAALTGLATAALAGSGPVAASAPRAAEPAVPTGADATGMQMVLLARDTTGAAIGQADDLAGAAARGTGATMTEVTGDLPATDGAAAVPAGAEAPPSPGAPPSLRVVVQPGDHFWSIAARRVHLALGREPSDAEVEPYWRALMAANAGRLAQPGNPNLLLPGQVLDLPG